MRNPFKNYVSYQGNREQLEAFAAELIKAGHTIDPEPFCGEWQIGDTHIITYPAGTDFGFYNHCGSSPYLYKRFRADQFAEALAAATEKA